MKRPSARAAVLGLLLVWSPVTWGLVTFVSPATFERVYARDLGPRIAQAIGRVTGVVPFSVAQALGLPLAVGLVVVLGAGLVRTGRLQRLRRWGPVLLAAASVSYGTGMAVWGFNYRREPILGRFAFPAGPSTRAEVAALGAWAVEAMNEVRTHVLEDEAGVFRLPAGVADAFARAVEAYGRAGVDRPWLAGDYAPPKPIWGSELASWIGIGGIYVPYTAEPHVNVAAPVSGLPFTACHELAHQRSVAREDEANFVGFLVAWEHGDADFRYSAMLRAAAYVVSAWQQFDGEASWAAWEGRSAAVERDLVVQRAWYAAHESPIKDASEKVNHAYLKSNGVRDGTESYGRMVDLLVAWRR